MTLRNRFLSIAAPVVIAVTWDTLILGARAIGFYKTFQENRASFFPADAMEHLLTAIQDYMDEEAA
ncbi:MAG: hypothetical protein NVS3B21_31690 [Acidimicrobiales bacterium]